MADDKIRRNWLDRAIGFLAPMAGLRRIRARAASDVIVRHYEGASTGRRTQGWNRSGSDAVAAVVPFVKNLRDSARDLVRNNGYAESAITTICDHVVGWGIVAKPRPVNGPASELWQKWAGTTACDADGRSTFAGLQHLVMRTVVESGEVLIRKRIRLPEDGLPIPVQVQVLEPDYLDTAKTVASLPNKGWITAGVEFDGIGRRVAYWLFPEHPGAYQANKVAASLRVGAEFVLHVYRQDRAGQVRGASWFAPVLLKFKDFDDFDDATLMKQKVAACLSLVTTDVDGTAPGLGTVDPANPTIDELQPGAILNLAPGRSVTVVDPPTVREYSDYTRTTLRGVATGLGVSYEDLTGDYSAVNFSSARMARLRHWARVEDWRWRTLVPQFCDPVWIWVMEVAGMLEAGPSAVPGVEWTAPPLPMIEPDREGLAYQRNIRGGLMTQSEALRERGYDPEAVFKEMAADNKRLDELGLILDSDARNTTQAGNPRSTAATLAADPSSPEPAATPAEPADEAA
jgi:lambda family phage portal protein